MELAIRLGLADVPANATRSQCYGVALLCGIGFTMSLFIGNLAFPNTPHLVDATKIGVLAGSVASAVMGVPGAAALAAAAAFERGAPDLARPVDATSWIGVSGEGQAPCSDARVAGEGPQIAQWIVDNAPELHDREAGCVDGRLELVRGDDFSHCGPSREPPQHIPAPYDCEREGLRVRFNVAMMRMPPGFTAPQAITKAGTSVTCSTTSMARTTSKRSPPATTDSTVSLR